MASKSGIVSRKRPTSRYGYVSLGGLSKRFRNEATGEVISNRKMSNIIRERELGAKISKERYTQEIKSGKRQYANVATRVRQDRASIGRGVKKEIPEIVRRDAALIIKYRTEGGYEGGYEALDSDKQDRFNDLFKRYPRSSVLEALGSPARRRSFRKAA